MMTLAPMAFAIWRAKIETPPVPSARTRSPDRKSTRLNSSHLGISYAVFCSRLPSPTLFPYTTLFRSLPGLPAPVGVHAVVDRVVRPERARPLQLLVRRGRDDDTGAHGLRDLEGEDRDPARAEREDEVARSEEHTSELQSLRHLVCRLLLASPLSYALSLHDALPISPGPACPSWRSRGS